MLWKTSKYIVTFHLMQGHIKFSSISFIFSGLKSQPMIWFKIKSSLEMFTLLLSFFLKLDFISSEGQRKIVININ